uniref:Uncharacterized protein n=1 Tax=Oryza barthii TaxID=65489 RepID=A0A0D3H5V8_9ORYZ
MSPSGGNVGGVGGNSSNGGARGNGTIGVENSNTNGSEASTPTLPHLVLESSLGRVLWIKKYRMMTIFPTIIGSDTR